MLESELKECTEFILKLWSSADLNDAEIGILRKDLKDFDKDMVLQALDEHYHASASRPHAGKLRQLLRDMKGEKAGISSREKIQDQSHADIIRNQWRKAGNPCDFTDLETYLRYYASLWNSDKCDKSEGYRSLFSSQLYNNLRDMGFCTPPANATQEQVNELCEQARQTARNFFCDGRITRDFFNQFHNELRGMTSPVGAAANDDMPW